MANVILTIVVIELMKVKRSSILLSPVIKNAYAELINAGGSPLRMCLAVSAQPV